MANVPGSAGVFIPGTYLNTCNSASFFGAQDAYGNIYPTGTAPGVMIEVGDNEAANLSVPGSPALFGGAYTWVQVDLGATAANCVAGAPAFLILSSYGVPTVTDASHATATGICVGFFINPLAYVPTPGNWVFIFCGAGRVNATFQAAPTITPGAIGDNIATTGITPVVNDTSATVVTTASIGLNLGALATVAAPAGTPTGTPATTGGTVAAGTNFAKIVAVSNTGGTTVPSTESASVTTTGTTASITWNWTASANAVSYQIWVGATTGSEANYFTSTTNSFVQTLPIASGTAGTIPTVTTATSNNPIYIRDILYRIPN